jgi:hypothetical protein
MKREIWIIGVDPPCPRCDLTKQRVERIAREMEASITIKNLVYTDFRSSEFSRSVGKELGTAKHVADKAGIDMDWNRVIAVVKDPPSKPEDYDRIDEGPGKQWSAEMDEALRPCEERADALNMLMTPVLVIDSKVFHHGSVPSVSQIQSWLAQ